MRERAYPLSFLYYPASYLQLPELSYLSLLLLIPLLIILISIEIVRHLTLPFSRPRNTHRVRPDHPSNYNLIHIFIVFCPLVGFEL